MILGRGKGKAGHVRIGGENGQVSVGCECQAANLWGKTFIGNYLSMASFIL